MRLLCYSFFKIIKFIMCLVGIVMAYQLSWKASASISQSHYYLFTIAASFMSFCEVLWNRWCSDESWILCYKKGNHVSLVQSKYMRNTLMVQLLFSVAQNAKRCFLLGNGKIVGSSKSISRWHFLLAKEICMSCCRLSEISPLRLLFFWLCVWVGGWERVLHFNCYIWRDEECLAYKLNWFINIGVLRPKVSMNFCFDQLHVSSIIVVKFLKCSRTSLIQRLGHF